jgi:hypothetical protein
MPKQYPGCLIPLDPFTLFVDYRGDGIRDLQAGTYRRESIRTGRFFAVSDRQKILMLGEQVPQFGLQI